MSTRYTFVAGRLIAFTALLAACSRSPAPEGPAPAPATATVSAPPASPASPAPAAPAAAQATVAAASAAPAGAADVSGEWSFSIDVQGQVVSGSMTLNRSGDAYSGQVAPDGMSAAPVRSVTVTGTRITIIVDAPDGEALVEATLSNGNRAVSGTLSYNGAAGTFTATKR